MARLPNDSPLNGSSGRLGKDLVLKNYSDKTVVSKYPDMSGIEPSESQKQRRNIFGEAMRYAQKVNRDPLLRAFYEKTLLPGESVFHKAKKEYLQQHKKGI